MHLLVAAATAMSSKPVVSGGMPMPSQSNHAASLGQIGRLGLFGLPLAGAMIRRRWSTFLIEKLLAQLLAKSSIAASWRARSLTHLLVKPPTSPYTPIHAIGHF
jgi:hypothetical protein